MNIVIYFLIFISKIIENALATLRLIVVANGKKTLGAFLQLGIAIVWILVTGVVVTSIRKDPLKILFFGLGSFIGSYVGSYIEEKIAMGNNILMTILDYDDAKEMTDIIRKNDFAVTSLEGHGKDSKKAVLMIMVARKKVNEVVDMIKNKNKDAVIISESVAPINGGYKK